MAPMGTTTVCLTALGLPPPPPPPPSPPQLSSKDSKNPPFLASPPSTTKSGTLSLIQNSGIIACLRANSAELAYEAASAALSAGVSACNVLFILDKQLEIVVTTPCVFQVVKQLVEEYPAMALGVGTVLNMDDVINAKNAGAKFLMSPVMVKDIMDDAQDGELLYIPGAMTPTEILSAYEVGAKIVKVYPVSALGGAQYISAIKKPFPQIPMVASQGVTLDSIGNYICSGASSVVLSDAIFNKEAMVQKDFDAIHELAYLASLQGKEAVESIIVEE